MPTPSSQTVEQAVQRQLHFAHIKFNRAIRELDPTAAPERTFGTRLEELAAPINDAGASIRRALAPLRQSDYTLVTEQEPTDAR